MEKPYSKSRLNRALHSFFFIIVATIVLFLVFEFSLTLVFNSQLKKAKASFKDYAGIDLDYKFVLFDVFYGAFVKSLSISKDNKPMLDVGSIRLKPDIFDSIVNRGLSCKEIYINRPHVYKVDELNKKYLSLTLANIHNSGSLIKSALVKVYNMNFMDRINLDLGGYVAFAQNKVLLSRGKIRILDSMLLGMSDIDQSNNFLVMPLDYAFEATYMDGDFVINKFELISLSAKLVMSGRMEDYADALDVDLKGDLKDFMLEDARMFNNEYAYGRGILNSKFNIKGPLDTADFRVDMSISDANLKVLDTLKLSKIDIDLVWDNKGLRSDNMTMLIDGSAASLSIDISREGAGNTIDLEFFSGSLDVLDDFKVNFQGNLAKSILEGDIAVAFKRKYEEKTLSRNFSLENFSLDLVDFSFGCKSAQLTLGEKAETESLVEESLGMVSPEEEEDEEIIRRLTLNQLVGNMSMTSESLEVYNLEGDFYGGTLKSDASFRSADSTLYYNSKIILKNVNTADLAQEFLFEEYKLSGMLSGSIILNSKLRENITGDIQIIDGELTDNAVLIAISNFFALPSLKSVSFSNLKVIFYKIWNQYDSKISLFSQDVSIYLDNKSAAGESLDGYLLVKISTDLMDESPRFRQLFKYIGYKEPTVYFPFQLKGYFEKPRIEWLENEFKEKLEAFLPESNKKLLQEALNSLVLDMSK